MNSEPTSYPLRVGVVGHRRLNDEAAVSATVQRVLDDVEGTLRQAAEQSGDDRAGLKRAIDVVSLTLVRPILKLLRLPSAATQSAPGHETGIDWTVISPLARGADRIVARAVLGKPGAKLQAVTPLPLDEYRKDFPDTKDRQEFEELLQLDGSPIELYNEQESAEVDWTNPLHRKQAYFNVGRYVVDACELLIVVWDGKPSSDFGGTGDVVRYAISRGRRVIWIDANEPLRPACLIVADDAGTEPFPGATVTRLPTLAKHLSLGYHRLAAYNRDPVVSEADVKQATNREVAQLQEQASEAGLPFESLRSIEQLLLPLYTRADLMAVAYQRLYLFGAKALFRLSATAVSVAVMQLLFFPNANWLIVFEVLAMLTAVLLLRVSRVEAWHEKWLNDRYMAEWLRSATFSAFLGGRHEGKRKANTLPFYEGPDRWFVDAFQDLVARARTEMPAIDLEALKQLLVEQWIAGQAAWHVRNAKRKHHTAHRYHRLGVACFCVTLVMATLHLFGVGHGDHAAHDMGLNRLGDVSLWISFLAVILPAWGASIHAIASLLEYDRIAERSKRMGNVLERIAERARRAPNLESLAAEIHIAEEIMAAENHEWVVSLTFRQLVLPA